ncbi:hypothetical protein OG571_47720 (plasmid) [Streptomyces sp. NBC_01369]|uniref:hypothetical protein n=1 Tax=Streptomyces sp. NBC_01369 TaxID=2903842 RepID=UPI002F91A2FD
MAALRYVLDITQDDLDAALACVSQHARAEEAGGHAANLAFSLYTVAQSLGERIRARLQLTAASHHDHDTVIQLRNEWNDLMCVVEPWQGREYFDEERFRTVEHATEAGAAFRSYALSQARKFAAGTAAPPL